MNRSYFSSDARGGVRLYLRVTPNARSDEIVGLWHDGDGKARLAVKVTAPPDKGKANAAVAKLLSRNLGLPKSQFSITAGETARLKTIFIEGEAALLAMALNNLAGDIDEC